MTDCETTNCIHYEVCKYRNLDFVNKDSCVFYRTEIKCNECYYKAYFEDKLENGEPI